MIKCEGVIEHGEGLQRRLESALSWASGPVIQVAPFSGVQGQLWENMRTSVPEALEYKQNNKPTIIKKLTIIFVTA